MVRTRSSINSTKMLGARQNCLTAAIDNSSFLLLRLGFQGLSHLPKKTLIFEGWLPISALSQSVTSYLGHGFQNRWLSDHSIATKLPSTVGRHRSIFSLQIKLYHVNDSLIQFLIKKFWEFTIFCSLTNHPVFSIFSLEVYHLPHVLPL